MQSDCSEEPHVYMINGSIVFDPNKKILYHLNDTANVKTLNVPTARCLELLLTRKGIVDQPTMYNYVWGENEHLITPNNLYQNISLIRKALSQLNCDINLILTLPRKGFSIHPAANIEEISADVIDKTVFSKKEPGTHIGDESPSNTVNERSIIKRLTIYDASVLFLVLSVIILFVADNINSPHEIKHFSDYNLESQEGGCYILYPQDRVKRNFPLAIERIKKTCSSYPWNYISYLDLSTDASVLSCKKPMGDNRKNDCISSYIIMGLTK